MHWRGVCLGHLSHFIRQTYSTGRRLHEQPMLGQLEWPPHHSLRLNFQISRTSGAWVDVVRQEVERLMPKASSKPVGGRDMDLIALYRGCLSTGCWRLERRLMCNRSVIPRLKNGSDAITCCSLYKIHPSTYGMFQAATGRLYVCMRSRNRVLYRCKRLCIAPACSSRRRPCRVFAWFAVFAPLSWL